MQGQAHTLPHHARDAGGKRNRLKRKVADLLISEWGRTECPLWVTSGQAVPEPQFDFVRYCPKAAICGALAHVRFVPKADIDGLRGPFGERFGLR
jgi:hypothetical protein